MIKFISILFGIALLMGACTSTPSPVAINQSPTPTTITLLVKPTATSMPTDVPATAVPTDIPTATLEATKAVTAIPNVDAEAEKKNIEAIKVRVDGFLNSKDGYTDKQLHDKMFTMNWMNQKDSEKLGIETTNAGLDTAWIQGINLGVMKVDGATILLEGVQDQDGKREVLPVQFLPTGVTNDNFTTGIYLEYNRDIDGLKGTQSLMKSEADFKHFTDKRLGEVVMFQLLIKTYAHYVNDLGASPAKGEWIKFDSLMDERVPQNINAARYVWRVKMDAHWPPQSGLYMLNEEFQKMGPAVPEVVINSPSDVGKLLDGTYKITQLPITDSLAVWWPFSNIEGTK